MADDPLDLIETVEVEIVEVDLVLDPVELIEVEVSPPIQAIDVEIEVGATGPPGGQGPPGPAGADGADGAPGAPGVGVPTGGTINQVLAKTSSADYATAWITSPTGIPEAPSDSKLYGRFNAAWAVAQPFDADLTSIAAYASTGQWLYRSAADTWSPVTISTGLSFSGGTLTCTVSTAGLATTTYVDNADALKANIASPTFTGDPKAPTPTAGDNDTSIATTAFVQGALTTALGSYVLKAGDTMTGDLTISKASPVLYFDKTLGGVNVVYGRVAGVARWGLFLGEGTTESGGASGAGGSDFVILRYNNSGAVFGPIPLKINRADGTMTLESLEGGNVTSLVLNKTATGGRGDVLWGRTNNLNRWAISLADSTTESGANAGSNFSITRYTDAGAFIDNPLTINRATGAVAANIPLPTYQSFTTAGSSGTYNSPAGCKRIKVRMVGGGGGGGSFTNGNPGTATTFGTGTCNGGGTGGTGNIGGGGGVSGGSFQFFMTGGYGRFGMLSVVSQFAGVGGDGGSNPIGQGGSGTYNGPGGSPVGYGSGGAGGAPNATTTTTPGCGGGSGGYGEQVLPAGSYSYSVGSGGGGQGANAAFSAASAGLGGAIFVEEFY